MEVWELTGLEPKCRLTEPSVASHCEAFGADSRRLAYLRSDRTMVVRDLSTGPVGQWRLPGERMHWTLAFHPDGQRLAVGMVAEGRAVIQVCDAVTGVVTARLPHDQLCHGVAWHPDGRRLAVGCDDLRIHLWDTIEQKELATWGGHKRDGVSLRGFNRAGNLLLSTDWGGMLRVWDTESGQEVFAIPLDWNLATCPEGEDGMRIISPDGGTRLRLLRLAGGREHRRLVHRTSAGPSEYHAGGLLSRDDRLLTLTALSPTGDWHLVLVDPASGQHLATLPAAPGVVMGALGHEPSGALLTEARGYGLLRWPVRSEANSLRHFGPPQHIPAPRWAGGWACSTDGQVVAVPNGNSGAWVGRLDKRERWLALQPQHDVGACAVSPDGRLVATCTWRCPPHEYGCKVWNAADGTLIKELSRHMGAGAGFSPDNHWLGQGNASGVRLWRVATWEEGPRLTARGTSFTFAPDSSLIAVGGDPGVVRLCVTETGREQARLEVPDATRFSPLCFSHDGSQLFAFGEDDRAVHVWDLRRIRRQLAELGLDWDAPPYPDAPPPAAAKPLRVTVDLGDLQHLADFPDPNKAVALFTLSLALQPMNPLAYLQRGRAYGRLNQGREAIADYSVFLILVPPKDPRRPKVLFRRATNYSQIGDQAAALADLHEMTRHDLRHMPWPDEVARRFNEAAWRSVKPSAAGPEREKALALARKAVELAPGDVLYRNTLGMLEYRLGRWRDAAATLGETLKNDTDYAGWDLFFLAMSYQQLGEAARAREAYDRAVRWYEEKKGSLPAEQLQELSAFRAEAEALLKPP
jgi:WD40 repeat protein/tetratricopeptide (TPR) repeat protein